MPRNTLRRHIHRQHLFRSTTFTCSSQLHIYSKEEVWFNEALPQAYAAVFTTVVKMCIKAALFQVQGNKQPVINKTPAASTLNQNALINEALPQACACVSITDMQMCKKSTLFQVPDNRQPLINMAPASSLSQNYLLILTCPSHRLARLLLISV